MAKATPPLDERLLYEVLKGDLQDRYAERGSLQVHPNYTYNPDLTKVYGTPDQTRVAVQAAYLLRWAGVNGKTTRSLDEEKIVPQLSDIHGSDVLYGELEPDRTFGLLGIMNIVELDNDRVTPSQSVRKVFLQHPHQQFTIIPPHRKRSHRFGIIGIRDGIRAHNLYTSRLYGPTAVIPLEKTDRTPDTDGRRRGFKVID